LLDVTAVNNRRVKFGVGWLVQLLELFVTVVIDYSNNFTWKAIWDSIIMNA